MTHGWLMSCLLLGATSAAPSAAAPTQVLIVGTIHLDNPGRDLLNPSVKDVLGARRQKEIAELVALLQKFQPTKIALEFVPGSSSLPKRFEKYLAGTYVLTADERDQIGLRLAKNLGQRAVYGVDASADLDFDKVFKYAEKNQQGAVVQEALADLEGKIKPKMGPAYMEGHSLREILADANTPEADDLGHGLYMRLLRVGKDKDYPGTDLVSRWYERNLRIATNIARLSGPGERIFVLMGAGHAKLLRQFVGEMPGFELVSCSRYLK